jgi:hypothetical protein
MAITPAFIIEKLKRVAKQGRREVPYLSQSSALDKIALALGYNNWSLLTKHVYKMGQSQLNDFHDSLYQNPKFQEYLPPIFPPFERADAVEEMTKWVERKFTPLIEFAYYDNESENGFSWADEDLVGALQDEFSDRYPSALIEEVGSDLEINHGPWGIEDYGSDE